MNECSYNIAIEYFKIGTAILLIVVKRQPACGIKVILTILTKIGCHGNAP